MTAKSPKIQDVASVAGVSTATVSRALSNPDLVSEKTRTLVLDAVKKTGYRVNRAAKKTFANAGRTQFSPYSQI